MGNYKKLEELGIQVLNAKYETLKNEYERDKEFIEKAINFVKELNIKNIEKYIDMVDNYRELVEQLSFAVIDYIVNKVMDHFKNILNEDKFMEIKGEIEEWKDYLYSRYNVYHIINFDDVDYYKSDLMVSNYINQFNWFVECVLYDDYDYDDYEDWEKDDNWDDDCEDYKV